MEQKLKNASLKQSFIYGVSCAVVFIIVLSAMTLWACYAFQSWLVPDSNMVYLTIVKTYADGTEVRETQLFELGDVEQSLTEMVIVEDGEIKELPEAADVKYSIEKIENSVSALNPKRKLAYTYSQAAMIVLPFLYSVAGIVLCTLWFYKNKLNRPIRILSEATANIAKQNLDFSVSYDSGDEMGQLCDSFEKMRLALYENNRKMWDMLKERRLLQASVAHDLRNPIAVIEGYAEHLQISAETGRLNEEKIVKTASNLQRAAKRLERYTDSIRDLNHLEELEIHRVSGSLKEVLAEITDDFSMIAKQKNRELSITNRTPDCPVMMDKQVFARILENIFSNALRYARKAVVLDFSLEESYLITTIWDDGQGFPEKILKSKDYYMFSTEDSTDEHMGMGLTISRILCKKHGGELKLANRAPNGAVVVIKIKCL